MVWRVCALCAAWFLMGFEAGVSPQTDSGLPPGMEAEAFAWLESLGTASTVGEREALLTAKPQWGTQKFVEASAKSLSTGDIKSARAWMGSGQGLVTVAERLGAPDTLAHALFRCGYLAYVSLDSTTSIAMFERALPLYDAVHDDKGLAVCCLNLGNMYDDTGSSRKALAVYSRALPIFEQTHRKEGEADCCLGIGGASANMGRYQDALKMLERARSLFQDLEDPEGQADCYLSIGEVYRETGLPSDAVTTFDQAQPLFKQAMDREGQAKCYLNTGAAYADQGRFQDACTAYDAARSLFLDTKDTRGLASCYLDTGNAYNHLDRFEEALAMLEQARSLYLDLKDTKGQALCYLNTGVVYNHTHQVLKALAMFEQARPLFKEIEDARNLAKCDIQIGRIYQATAQPSKALQTYEEALTSLETVRGQTRDPALSAAVESDFSALPAALTTLYVQQGQPGLAFQAAQRGNGVALRNALRNPPLTPEELTSEEQRRLQDLRDANEQAESQLSQQAKTSGPTDQHLLLQRDKARTELSAFETILRARYPRWNRLDARPASLDQLAHALGSHTAVLEILADEKRLGLLLLRVDHNKPLLTAQLVPVSRADLEAWTSACDEQLARGADGDPLLLRKRLRQLYDALIHPVAGQLQGIDMLVVCPDGPLHNVPFTALLDPKGRYLIERLALTTAPSASGWEAARYLNDTRKQEATSHPLVVTLSRFGGRPQLVASVAPGGARGGMEDLPNARLEAAAVRDTLGAGWTEMLSEDHATVDAVKRAATNASVLHFVTHAYVNDAAPLMSALVLAPSGKEDLGLLYAQDVYGLHLKARLAVLSACSTGAGAATGEGLVGLAWSFLVAGCPSTIATRYPLDDTSGRAWVEAFYRAYVRSKERSVAGSFRFACLGMLKTQGRKVEQLWRWAGWTLTGDDR